MSVNTNKWTRTIDLSRMKGLLYQLSYTGLFQDITIKRFILCRMFFLYFNLLIMSFLTFYNYYIIIFIKDQ